jgi:hypothetical protein
MVDTQYVLVIHGTWNPPDSVSPTWHQLHESDSQNFCRKLNDALEGLGFGRAVWRHVSGQEIHFGWSGTNKDADRIAAGQALCELIWSIVRRDPSARIHLVAHSHGANVVLYALHLYLERLRTEGIQVFQGIRRRLAGSSSQEAIVGALQETFGLEVLLGFAAEPLVYGTVAASMSYDHRPTMACRCSCSTGESENRTIFQI